MGTQHKDGYSADVEGFLVVDGRRIRLTKTNGERLVLADLCELSPGTEGEILIIVDGNSRSRLIGLPDGVSLGQRTVRYTVAAPF